MPPSQNWLLLAASLPGREASTARVRLWRTLQEIGAANLRDGVTLLPASAAARERLGEVLADVESSAGSGWLFEIAAQAPALEKRLAALFDRTEAYAGLGPAMTALRQDLPRLDEAAARRRLEQIERSLESVATTDFFPNAGQAQSREKLDKLRASVNRKFSPEEPAAARGEISRCDSKLFRRQRWATRKHLWVDRAASAWLIRRFIDPEATFHWLDRPADCPPEAHGFDFDGARFTHVGDRVTFEVLLESFALDRDSGLAQIGALVHYLDVGGETVSEAAGFAAVLSGLRDGAADDDALLAGITPVLDALYTRYSSTAS
jgi:hypothetical protein